MVGGRPREEGAARTHIRVSYKTKELINRLKVEHGYQTSDEVLTNLLPQPQPQPQLQLTTQPVITKDMLLQRSDLNRLISATSKEIYQNHVKPKQQQSKPGLKPKCSGSFSKSNHKF